MPNPKKLELFLVDGEPDGRKVITLLGWSGRCLVFPRNKLRQMGNDKISQDLRGSGVYFLFGRGSEDSLTTLTYIGKADNIFDRLNVHNQEEKYDFWHMTVIFTFNDTGDHHHHLETQCIALAREAQHFGYILKNINRPQPRPHEFNASFIKEFVDNINLILTTIGYPILQKIEPENEEDLNNPIFSCQNKNLATKGVARMTNEGFIVYKGSTITVDYSPAIVKRKGIKKVINKLLAEGIIEKKGNIYVFEKDHNFVKPSTPAILVLGYSVDGWNVWKTADGKTLKEVFQSRT